jgi:drug/metabolite transporter (DMT)-like permease
MTALRPLPAAIAGAGAPAEDPLRGIILYAAATILFATADTTAKYLTAFLPIIEIIWIRYAIFVMFAASLVYRTRPSGLALRSPSMQLARGVFLVGSSILFVFGVSRMPISQATSISFVAPMLITILSIPLLGEQVGIRRWAAVVVGLIGVLIVVRPGGGTLGAAALFSLGSAFCWAMALIITRKMATSERPTTTLLISATTGLLLLSLLLPFNFAWPTPFQAALTLLLGSFASLGQWMVVLAHRQAPASALAPFSYGQLLWVSIGGYLVFAAIPDRWTVLGSAIIIASGLYTAHRERMRARQRRAG